MTSDLDIFRTANVLVKHYGEDGPSSGRGFLLG